MKFPLIAACCIGIDFNLLYHSQNVASSCNHAFASNLYILCRDINSCSPWYNPIQAAFWYSLPILKIHNTRYVHYRFLLLAVNIWTRPQLFKYLSQHHRKMDWRLSSRSAIFLIVASHYVYYANLLYIVLITTYNHW